MLSDPSYSTIRNGIYCLNTAYEPLCYTSGYICRLLTAAGADFDHSFPPARIKSVCH